MHPRPSGNRQRGAIALLPALLLTLVTSSILATLFYRHQLEISRTTRQLHGDSALLMALSAENLARSLLTRDRQLNDLDTLNESWARPLPPVDVDGASVTACLHDAQARLNLNGFRDYDSGRLAGEIEDSSRGSPAQTWLAIRERVLRMQSESGSDSRLSLDRLIDYIDSDSVPVSAFGGEDDLYARATPARRASNQPLTQLAELELVDGWQARDLDLLATYVDILPVATPINVNTASAAVLESLSPRLDAAAAQQLAAARPWQTLSAFYADLAEQTGIAPALAAAELPAEMVSLRSDFFTLEMLIEIGAARLHAVSLLQRTGEDVGVLRRELHWIPELETPGAGPAVCGMEQG